MISGKINFWIGWGLFILFIGCFIFILIGFPIGNDDWWCLKEFRDIKNLKEIFRLRFYYDNVRLGNFIGIILLKAPRFISVTISAIAISLGLWFMIKICNIKLCQWEKLSILLFLVWIAPIWEDGMFSHMYTFNYIIEIPFLFGLIYIFVNPDKFSLIGCSLLGIILGMWHEAYAIAFLSGAILDLIFHHKGHLKERTYLILSVAIGLIWHFITPAIYFRQSHFHFSSIHINKLVFCWIYFIYLTVWLTIHLFINKKTTSGTLQLFALSSGILLIIVWKTGIERAFMPGSLITCCALSVLLFEFKPNIFFRKLIALSLSSFTILSLSVVCYETVKIRKSTYEIIDIIRQSDKKASYVFAPCIYSWEMPIITLRRPDAHFLVPQHPNYSYILDYYRRNLLIVPKALSCYEANKGIKIYGNTDCRLWNGHLVSSNLNDTCYKVALIYNGIRKEYSTVVSTIFPGKDNLYVYILPLQSSINSFLGEPKTIIFIDNENQ